MEKRPEDGSDTFIEEVRERRRRVSAKFGHNVDRFFDELQRREREHPERVVKPRKHEGTESTA